MSLMQAVRIHRYGGPETLQLDHIPVPAAGPDELLVRVHAAGVNPVDWKIREGYLAGFLTHELPLTLGWDVAGEVAAVGAEVSGWQIGDAVYSRPDIARNGSYAQYMVLRAAEAARKPLSLNWVQAAAVPLAALTAWQALYEMAAVEEGERVLIHAGAGGVGSFAIQLAKLAGAHVISTASARNLDYVRSLGADDVIDYTRDDFGERLSGLDLVFDTMGGEVAKRSFAVLREGGRMVSICEPPNEALAAEHGIKPLFCFVQPNAEQLGRLGELVDAGKLHVEVEAVLPLSEVAQAHARSQSGRTRGKIVLSVD
ncbi:NADP-dependent oxidoreductase [Chitinibacteraceae bacterium HSL-7]